MQSLNITAPMVVLHINGKPYARVTAMQWQSSTPKKENRGVDSPLAYELAPTTASCTVSLNVIRTLGDGGAEGAGMAGRYEDLQNEKYFTATLIERSTDTVVFRADNCSVTNQTWSAPARGRIEGVINFQCLSWQNEVVPAQQS